jgi:hypothetical protein
MNNIAKYRFANAVIAGSVSFLSLSVVTESNQTRLIGRAGCGVTKPPLIHILNFEG